MRSILAFLAFVSFPLIGTAQVALWTPQHVAKLRIVTEAVISPDGTQVAYVLAVPRDLSKEKDGGSWTELHVVDTKGNSTPFITGQVNVGNISWTPDGKSIAFLTKRDLDTARSLYMIGAKGGEARRVISHATDILGYSINGKGDQVAFLATERMPASKKKQVDQGFNQEIYEEDQPFVRVWLESLVYPVLPAMVKLEGSASELHFNPRERKLAVALAPSPGIDDHIMFRKVHIVEFASLPRKGGEEKQPPPANAGGSLKITKLDNPGKLGQVAWSPDGKKLAMITGADKHDPKEGQLALCTDGKTLRQIVRSKSHAESLAFTPRGMLTLESLGVASVEGFLAWGKDLVETDMEEFSGRVVSHLSLSANGESLAYIAHGREHPPEIYFRGAIERDNVSRVRLTNSNPWLKDMKFAKQEVIKYKAKDGLELEGILIRPLNEEKGKRYPLVLHVHGGPEAHYSNGWITRYADLGQVAAARGMASFYPNYRGSTGYGVEFSMKGQKEAAGKEFDDLIDGVDHLIKMGLVDEKKVGITGGSYGGYATAWGSTYYSHRFAAGVMFVGISDWVSCSGTTDIPQEMFLVHHRKWLWDDWDYFKKASPIAHLDKHKTPLLIMHGKNDPRVNPGQSLEMYRHLKVRNQAPVRLVLYPGEGHGNRRAASRLDYNIRSLQWMEHYLKGPGGKMPALEIDYGLPVPAMKTSNAGWDDRQPLAAKQNPWLGRGCPCCIGW